MFITIQPVSMALQDSVSATPGEGVMSLSGDDRSNNTLRLKLKDCHVLHSARVLLSPAGRKAPETDDFQSPTGSKDMSVRVLLSLWYSTSYSHLNQEPELVWDCNTANTQCP